MDEERKLLRACLGAFAALLGLFTVVVIGLYELAQWVWGFI